METKTAMNPYLDYSLEDLFYFLEEAEDAGQEAKAERIRKAIDARVMPVETNPVFNMKDYGSLVK